MKQHKDIQYPIKTFRISEEVYKELKVGKKENESWNIYFKRLLKYNNKKV